MAADFRPGSSEELRHEIATHKSVASRSSPELAQPEIQVFHASENHLVGGFNQNPSEKMMELKSLGMIIPFPIEWKVIKFHGSSHHQPSMANLRSKNISQKCWRTGGDWKTSSGPSKLRFNGIIHP